MRILYLTNESPVFPAGGIGTYIGCMAAAMAAAGHEVYLLTWTYEQDRKLPRSYAPFKEGNVKILWVKGDDVWRHFPHGPYNHAFSAYIAKILGERVNAWGIDVIEATDYLSPALIYFQEIQSSKQDREVLCVTYNHGFIEDFYDADQIYGTEQAKDDLVGERQQCRVSDLVIAPSRVCVSRLASYGITANVTMVREPYDFEASIPVHSVINAATYLGRISISKGIDKFVLVANVLDNIIDLRSLLLIGKCVSSPFRQTDVQAYVRRRLAAKLSDLVVFTGSLKRQAALELLKPGALSPSLGSAETFSYACIETIDRGLVPIVRAGTPMAEFFPPDLQSYVLEEDLSSPSQLEKQLGRVISDGRNIVARTQEYNEELLRPSAIAEQMTAAYEAALRMKTGFRARLVRQPALVDDVTIMIPAYKPGPEFLETIDSIVMQTAGAPSVVICNDGTAAEDADTFEYARFRLPDCRIIDQPNTGLLGARNTLIDRSETALSVFLDTDDLLAPEYLARVLEAYNHSINPPHAVLTNRQNFFESVELVLRDFMEDHVHWLRNDFRMTALIETSILQEIRFDMSRRNGEADDWVFWLEFMAAGYRSVMVPQSLFHYRSRTGSMSWPWSMGQSVGTHTMLRELGGKVAWSRPSQAPAIARALYSDRNTQS